MSLQRENILVDLLFLCSQGYFPVESFVASYFVRNYKRNPSLIAGPNVKVLSGCSLAKMNNDEYPSSSSDQHYSNDQFGDEMKNSSNEPYNIRTTGKLSQLTNIISLN